MIERKSHNFILCPTLRDPNVGHQENEQASSNSDRGKGRFDNVQWPQYDTVQKKYHMIGKFDWHAQLILLQVWRKFIVLSNSSFLILGDSVLNHLVTVILVY